MSLQALMPVVLFVLVNRLAGLRWAVVAATLWSLWIVIDRRRRRLPLGKVMPLVTGAVLLRGAIGAITGSETVYFGLGIATKFAVALGLGLSVVVRRPAAGLLAPHVLAMPEHVRSDRVFIGTMSTITSIAALYYTVSASFDVWLFRRSSVEGYVVVRFLANWPLSVAAVLAILALAQRRLPPLLENTPLRELFERRLTTYYPPAAQKDGTSGEA